MLALTGDVAVAQNGLKFSVNDQTGLDIVSNAVAYDLFSGVIQFQVSGPLFCFDFDLDTESVLYVNVTDGDGAARLDAVGVRSGLRYDIGGSRIDFRADSSTQCFFRGDSNEFGLFGQAPQAAVDEPDDDRWFVDRFQAEPELVIEYVGLESGLISGSIDYQIRIRNTGNGDIDLAGFQELSPGDLFSLHSYGCQPLYGGAECGSDQGADHIRLGGLYLPANSAVEVSVTRQVVGDPGTLFEIHAGAVSGRSWRKPDFDARVLSLEVES